MKKLVYTTKILTILSLLLLSSCKKDNTPFPTPSVSNGTFPDFSYRTPSLPVIADADGILAAVYVHNYHIVTVSPVEQEFQYGMAQFASTTGNFSILTNADSVWVDTSKLIKATNLSYLSNPLTYSLNFSNHITWNVKGAGSVPAMTYTLTNNLPAYNLFTYTSTNYWNEAWIPTYPRTLIPLPARPAAVVPPQPTQTDSIRWLHDESTYSSLYAVFAADSAKRRSDSTFNVTPFATIPLITNSTTTTGTVTTTTYTNLVTNADTLVIIFNDGAGFNYVRKAPASDTAIYFYPTDFASYPNYNFSTLTMQINLIKYNSIIVAGKKYYYIRMSSYVKYWATS